MLEHVTPSCMESVQVLLTLEYMLSTRTQTASGRTYLICPNSLTLNYVYLYLPLLLFIFFFNDTATTEIYTLSLHDALPIYPLISQNPQLLPKWEYKVSRFDSGLCSSESELAVNLNVLGQDGWELVSYERFPAPFPRDAEGTLLIKPAATGPGAQTQPQTADSFTGNITMRMAQTSAGG